MIHYKFNDKTGFVETKITGETSVNDLVEYIISLSRETVFPGTIKILTDASDACFSIDVTPDDLYKIVEANKKSIAARDLIYDAFVVSGSFETALGLLYTEFSKAENYHFNIFSTKKAAEEWLNQF